MTGMRSHHQLKGQCFSEGFLVLSLVLWMGVVGLVFCLVIWDFCLLCLVVLVLDVAIDELRSKETGLIVADEEIEALGGAIIVEVVDDSGLAGAGESLALTVTGTVTIVLLPASSVAV